MRTRPRATSGWVAALLAAFAMAAPASAQVMTITGATPSTYSGPGETITFRVSLGGSNAVTNSVELTRIAYGTIGPINCVGLPLDPLESTTCSFTYVTQAGDVFGLNQSGTFKVTTLNAPRTKNIANTFRVPFVPVPPTASIVASTASVTENGAQSLSYTVTLSDPAAAPISVYFSLGGSATTGVDYAASANPLVIATGGTTGTITLDPTGDATVEADETVDVSLVAGSGYTLGAPTSATGIIANDDVPSLSINDVSMTEGNAGTVNATFTVTLGAASGQSVTVNYATANGSATAGSDYIAASGTLAFSPGQTSQTVVVPVIGDTTAEADESFSVNLNSAVNASIAIASGTGTILNDDMPSLSILDRTVSEGNAGTTLVTFTVRLSGDGAPPGGVTFDISTANGTATAGSDYVAKTLTGQSIGYGGNFYDFIVQVNGDTVNEPDETFSVNVSNVTVATVADAQALGTILNDDVVVVIAPATLPSATAANAYSQILTASGGAAPYAFAVTAGALPAGLTLSTNGTLSGTPTAGGSFNFTVTATDGNSIAGARAYVLTVSAPTITIAPTTLPAGTVGVVYSQSVTAAGGVSPYAYAVTGGALPAGLSLASNGALSGTPTAGGTFNLTITATDSSTGTGPYTGSRAYAWTINVAPPVAGAVSATVAYGSSANPITLNLSGGAATSVAVATAAAHGTVTASGTSITYTPTVGYAGSDSFTYTASNASGTSAAATVTVIVSSPSLQITAAQLLSAGVGNAYTQTFSWSGGTAPYSGYSVTGLPAGLSVTGTTANSVTLSGTPTAAGSFNLIVSATDSSTGIGPFTKSQTFTLTVNAPTLLLTPAAGMLPLAYAAPYSQTFTGSGGIDPYSYVLSGTLPAGVSFNAATGTLAGTPTQPGSFPVTVTATDSSTGAGAPFSIMQGYNLQVAAPTIVLAPASLPAGSTGSAYPATSLSASGGLGAYSYAVTARVMPAGLTLSSAGEVSGTPTAAGSFPVTVTATDSAGQTGSRAYTLSIGAPTLTLSPATLANATAETVYTQTISASGGTAPYSYAVSSGSLPAGLSLDAGTGELAGTATVDGDFNVTITVTDSSTGAGAPFSATQSYTLHVDAPAISVTPATLPNGTAGTAYPATALTANGGVGPYSYVLTGTLPAGMAFDAASATLSGTPTAAGSFSLNATATDAHGFSDSINYTLTVASATLNLDPASLPAGTAGTAYSQTISASGGIAPYSYALTSGALPVGLSFVNDALSGTPTTSGSFTFAITATDSTGGTAATVTNNYTLTIASPTLALTPAALPAGTGGVAYSQTLTASGGIAPYNYAVTAGSLPAGLTLTAAGQLSGTPTVAGSFTFSVTATDSTTGVAGTVAHSYTLALAAPTLVISPATLPNGVRGVAYTQTLGASGGTAGYTFAVTAGTLPTGLTLSSAGVLSGTPTVAASNSFTVTATDALGFSTSQAYTPVIAEVVPVANADAATTLGVTAATVAVTNNDTGLIDSIAITTAPAHGAVVVTGLTAVYTASADFSGTDTFAYTATGPGGTSAPALVTITVNPVAVAVSRTLAAVAGLPVTVDLTQGATGGPFTAATLVALNPSTSGTAAIVQIGTGASAIYRLTYTPLATFSGAATATFTLGNAFSTSAEAVITFNVAPRPDPSQDAEVRGLLNAQAAATRRFATSQMNNFQQRLERLHGAGERNGFDNGLSVATDQRCEQKVGAIPGRTCDRNSPGDEFDGGNGPAGSGLKEDPGNALGNGTGGTRGPAFGVWAGGLIRSGNQDGRNGSATVDFETDGVSFGADYRFNDAFVFGAGVGYGRDDSDIGEHGSRSEGDAFTLAAYASYSPGDRFFLDGLVGYQQLNYDLRRYVTVNANTVEGSRDGDQWFASVSAGADLQNGDWQLTPYARVDVAQATLEGYTESGDPLYSLAYGDMDVDTTTGNLGLRVEYRMRTRWGLFSPQLRLEYQHDFEGNGAATMQYADFLTGPVYRAELDNFDRNRVNVGLGGLFGFDTWSMRLEYRGLIGSGGDSDHGVLLNIEKRL